MVQQNTQDRQKAAKQKSRELVFKALAHLSRLSIVEALVEREYCVNELTDLPGIDASTTSPENRDACFERFRLKVRGRYLMQEVGFVTALRSGTSGTG